MKRIETNRAKSWIGAFQVPKNRSFIKLLWSVFLLLGLFSTVYPAASTFSVTGGTLNPSNTVPGTGDIGMLSFTLSISKNTD